jgi:hypothetical protein
MKHLIIAALVIAAFSCLSCSVEENAAAQEATTSETELFDNLFSEGLDIDIDFSRLFEYSTVNEAKVKTNESIAFIVKDAREELAKRPDCTHASVAFFITSGKATMHAVSFLNKEQKVYKEHNAITKAGVRPYTHLIGNSTKVYLQHEESLAKDYVNLISKSRIDNFLEDKLAGSGYSQFEVHVAKDGTAKVYGYNKS